MGFHHEEPDKLPEPIPRDEAEAEVDFSIAVYRGCVLPEDYKPVRITSWSKWAQDNPDDYSPAQLDTIKARLLAGKSWVAFTQRLETICAPEHYLRKAPYNNPVRPRDRI